MTSSVSSKALVAKTSYDKSGLLQIALSQMPKELIGIISSYANEILGGLYGPEAWKNWKNVDVLDDVPPAPSGHLQDRILLYIPLRISFKGVDKDLTLKALKNISGGFKFFYSKIKEEFGNDTAQGWVFLDKDVIPESRGKDYATQEKMVQAKGCSMMHPIEAITLNQMVFAFTGVRLFGENPMTYTRCNRKVDGQHPVVVGGFGSRGLHVIPFIYNSDRNGVACALRKS